LGPIPKSLRPIFCDREDFTAGHTLNEQTLAALDASDALIVVCSPASAQSHYVNEEIRLFRSRHPERHGRNDPSMESSSVERHSFADPRHSMMIGVFTLTRGGRRGWSVPCSSPAPDEVIEQGLFGCSAVSPVVAHLRPNVSDFASPLCTAEQTF